MVSVQAFNLIVNERQYQINEERFQFTNSNMYDWMNNLGQEVKELEEAVKKAFLAHKYTQDNMEAIKKEAVQVAAAAIVIIEYTLIKTKTEEVNT